MSGPTNHAPTHFWKQQSPIDLIKADSLFVKFPRSFLQFDYRDAPFAGQFEGDHGHENYVLTKPHQGQHPPTLKLGTCVAELVKIHLHTPSEHDLERENQCGEIHLIHKVYFPLGGSELVVIGVFFHETTNLAAKNAIFQTWGDHPDKQAVPHMDPRTLLPKFPKGKTYRWYRYEGSLTSAPYSEIVSWVVLVDPVDIHSDDLTALKAHAAQPERKAQSVNRRFVLRNFP